MPHTSQLVAVILALTGAFLLVTNGNFHSFSVAWLAVVWGTISALTAAFYTLFPKGLLQKYGAATSLDGGCSLVVSEWALSLRRGTFQAIARSERGGL